MENALRGKKEESVEAVLRQSAVRRSSKEKGRYNFVLPALTWKKDMLHPALSLLCPRSERQLDPRIHHDIVRLLADCNTPGFGQDFITFGENDVFDRVIADGNQYFGAIADPNREFSEPFIARVYLDLIKLALDDGKLQDKKENALVSALLLPDVDGRATAFRDLYASASLPTDIPGLHLPPILHSDLATHPLFSKKWKLQKFTMANFLEGGVLQDADKATRGQFWKWLCRNERRVAQIDRPKLADLAIWPDEGGRLCKISDLCDPRARRVGKVLGDSIRRPHEQVRRSRFASFGGKARTSIRRVPSQDELANWLATRTARFEMGRRPGANAAHELRSFEADLVVLLRDAAIARQLKRVQVPLPALAQDGSIQARTALVKPSHNNVRLALPSRFLLKNREQSDWLDRLSSPLNGPTAAMLMDSFVEDSSNFVVLQPRLKYFLSVTKPGDSERVRLAGTPIIPVQGQPRAPAELAFRGNKGDYWGAWKTQISGKGLSQDDQSRYRSAGVTSAIPNAETSRDFFSWLADQNQAAIRHHIPCVLRHILHRVGPTHWAKSFTDIPFIPVKERDGVRLVSLRTTQRSPVYLSDAGEIGDAIIREDRAVLLVIDHVKEVTEPISEQLRILGVKSLRDVIKEPKRVSGTGDVVADQKELVDGLRELQSSSFRRTFRKRLNELEVASDLLCQDWHDKLARVREIHLADKVKAQYIFRRRSYEQEIEAGFDFGSGILYMKRDRNTKLRSFYESLAKQLIFKAAARPIDLLALQRAIEFEIADLSFGRPSGHGTRAHDDEEGERNEYGDIDAEPGEALAGHSPFNPNPERNSPKPEPLSTKSEGRSRSPVRHVGTPDSSGGTGIASRQDPQLEKDHRNALKLDHYASHCQMCLCERSPQELAPVGSYVEWEEVRRKIVDAHHSDLVSAGGARHAGNLILLCTLHHNNYGRQLSRAGITAALRGGPKQVTIRFGQNSEEVKGQEIELEISGTGEVVKLFFTDYHLEYWLSQETTSD